MQEKLALLNEQIKKLTPFLQKQNFQVKRVYVIGSGVRELLLNQTDYGQKLFKSLELPESLLPPHVEHTKANDLDVRLWITSNKPINKQRMEELESSLQEQFSSTTLLYGGSNYFLLLKTKNFDIVLFQALQNQYDFYHNSLFLTPTTLQTFGAIPRIQALFYYFLKLIDTDQTLNEKGFWRYLSLKRQGYYSLLSKERENKLWQTFEKKRLRTPFQPGVTKESILQKELSKWFNGHKITSFEERFAFLFNGHRALRSTTLWAQLLQHGEASTPLGKALRMLQPLLMDPEKPLKISNLYAFFFLTAWVDLHRLESKTTRVRKDLFFYEESGVTLQIPVVHPKYFASLAKSPHLRTLIEMHFLLCPLRRIKATSLKNPKPLYEWAKKVGNQLENPLSLIAHRLLPEAERKQALLFLTPSLCHRKGAFDEGIDFNPEKGHPLIAWVEELFQRKKESEAVTLISNLRERPWKKKQLSHLKALVSICIDHKQLYLAQRLLELSPLKDAAEQVIWLTKSCEEMQKHLEAKEAQTAKFLLISTLKHCQPRWQSDFLKPLVDLAIFSFEVEVPAFGDQIVSISPFNRTQEKRGYIECKLQSLNQEESKVLLLESYLDKLFTPAEFLKRLITFFPSRSKEPFTSFSKLVALYEFMKQQKALKQLPSFCTHLNDGTLVWMIEAWEKRTLSATQIKALFSIFQQLNPKLALKEYYPVTKAISYLLQYPLPEPLDAHFRNLLFTSIPHLFTNSPKPLSKKQSKLICQHIRQNPFHFTSLLLLPFIVSLQDERWMRKEALLYLLPQLRPKEELVDRVHQYLDYCCLPKWESGEYLVPWLKKLVSEQELRILKVALHLTIRASEQKKLSKKELLFFLFSLTGKVEVQELLTAYLNAFPEEMKSLGLLAVELVKKNCDESTVSFLLKNNTLSENERNACQFTFNRLQLERILKGKKAGDALRFLKEKALYNSDRRKGYLQLLPLLHKEEALREIVRVLRKELEVEEKTLLSLLLVHPQPVPDTLLFSFFNCASLTQKKQILFTLRSHVTGLKNVWAETLTQLWKGQLLKIHEIKSLLERVKTWKLSCPEQVAQPLAIKLLESRQTSYSWIANHLLPSESVSNLLFNQLQPKSTAILCRFFKLQLSKSGSNLQKRLFKDPQVQKTFLHAKQERLFLRLWSQRFNEKEGVPEHFFFSLQTVSRIHEQLPLSFIQKYPTHCLAILPHFSIVQLFQKKRKNLTLYSLLEKLADSPKADPKSILIYFSYISPHFTSEMFQRLFARKTSPLLEFLLTVEKVPLEFELHTILKDLAFRTREVGIGSNNKVSAFNILKLTDRFLLPELESKAKTIRSHSTLQALLHLFALSAHHYSKETVENYLNLLNKTQLPLNAHFFNHLINAYIQSKASLDESFFINLLTGRLILQATTIHIHEIADFFFKHPSIEKLDVLLPMVRQFRKELTLRDWKYLQNCLRFLIQYNGKEAFPLFNQLIKICEEIDLSKALHHNDIQAQGYLVQSLLFYETHFDTIPKNENLEHLEHIVVYSSALVYHTKKLFTGELKVEIPLTALNTLIMTTLADLWVKLFKRKNLDEAVVVNTLLSQLERLADAGLYDHFVFNRTSSYLEDLVSLSRCTSKKIEEASFSMVPKLPIPPLTLHDLQLHHRIERIACYIAQRIAQVTCTYQGVCIPAETMPKELMPILARSWQYILKVGARKENLLLGTAMTAIERQFSPELFQHYVQKSGSKHLKWCLYFCMSHFKNFKPVQKQIQLHRLSRYAGELSLHLERENQQILDTKENFKILITIADVWRFFLEENGGELVTLAGSLLAKLEAHMTPTLHKRFHRTFRNRHKEQPPASQKNLEFIEQALSFLEKGAQSIEESN